MRWGGRMEGVQAVGGVDLDMLSSICAAVIPSLPSFHLCPFSSQRLWGDRTGHSAKITSLQVSRLPDFTHTTSRPFASH